MKQQVIKLCKELGVVLEWDKIGIHYEIRIDAPKGKVFKGYDFHQSVTATLGEYAWDLALKDIQLGFEDCELPNCDMCNDY